MLTPPNDLSEEELASALAGGWSIGVTGMSYRPLGFGSHHWEVHGTRGARWFLTVYELESKRLRREESPARAFVRLRASLRAAADLRECGAAFVVAPMPARDGEPALLLRERFAVALYPFVTGRSFEWGEFADRAHRRGVLDMVVALHTAPERARRNAATEDFAIAHRDELEAALGADSRFGARAGADLGPYAGPAAALLARNAGPVRRLLARYDELAGRSRPAGMVLTHGETHPGNTMLTPAGWALVDWDTALVAPPERDLWSLDPGDGSVLRGYADATGVTAWPPMLELYRIRWDLADLAVGVSQFSRPHAGSRNDHKSWDDLRSLVTRVVRQS